MEENYIKEYSFEIEDAIKYGVEEAIMLKNIKFWIAKNAANKKHFYDGKYWTYNSISAFAQLFPFWTEKQIIRILNNLISKGAIISGNYNKSAYDRTKWYALTVKSICPNGQMEMPKQSNGNDQTGRPIPYINTDINTNIKTDNKENNKKEKFQFEEFYRNFPKKVAKDYAEKCYYKAIKKATHDDIMRGLNKYLREIKQGKIGKQFIKHPSTWLNQGCWQDEYEQEPQNSYNPYS